MNLDIHSIQYFLYTLNHIDVATQPVNKNKNKISNSFFI